MADTKEIPLKKQRKNAYWAKLETCLNSFKNILIITVDFVGSRQMQTVRAAIRGRGEILMGKNTIIRKVLRENAEKNPALLSLLPLIKGNMGFVFTNGDLNAIRKEVTSFKLPAGAKAGVIAPINVTIPAGPTDLDPGQTSFFQTLNISTKITKGSIEITSAVRLCFKGEKVTTSAVALLSKLNIKPFEYGIEVTKVFEDGSVYSASVLDLDMNDLINKFCGAVANLAAVSFAIDEVNAATVPHSFGRAFNMLCAIGIESDYIFEECKIVKEMLDNPDAFAGPAAGGDASAPAAAAAVVEEEEEDEPTDMGGLFGDDDADEEGDY